MTIVRYSSYPSKEGGKNKTIGQLQVLGKAWDTQTGGFNFDLRIAEILADRFNANWHKKKNGAGQDVRNHVRPMTRLRMEASKIREVLSANNEYPFKVDSLHADVDLNTKVGPWCFVILWWGLDCTCDVTKSSIANRSCKGPL